MTVYVKNMFFTCFTIICCSISGVCFSASQAQTGAAVYIISPKNGAIVSGPVKIKFGIKNMTLMPAGIAHPYSGHHHLLVNVDKLPDMSKPIPSDSKHIHFGKGQKETTLDLPPGKHTLQLLLGDHLHQAHHKPVISEKITITVKKK